MHDHPEDKSDNVEAEVHVHCFLAELHTVPYDPVFIATQDQLDI
jgi:hypothetical protein